MAPEGSLPCDRSRYEAMFRSAVEFAIIVTDRDGLVTDWNPGAERILGWTAAEMAGRDVATILTAEDQVAGVAAATRLRALETGLAVDERWHLRRDGTRFWAPGETMPLLGADGVATGFVTMLRDRTARHEAAREQRQETEFLRGVLSASVDCVKVLDLEGRLLFMTPSGQAMMDVDDFEKVRGRPWAEFWAGPWHGNALGALDVARAGGVGRFQGTAQTLGGAARYWDVQVSPIRGPDGAPERLLAVSRDVSASRQTQAALRDAEGLNDSILNASQDCIVLLDLEGHTQYVSPGGIASMEVSDVGAILGLSWLRVWSGADHAAAVRAVGEARAGGIGRFQGFCATHRGTPKWWDVAISPLSGPDGTPERLVSVGRDVTAQKTLEAELRHINANLEQRVLERTRDRNRLWTLSVDIMLVATFDAVITAVNPAWTAVLGWTEPELVGSNLLSLIHPDDLEQTAGATVAMRGGASYYAFENRYRHRDGSYRWISWSAVPGDGHINAVGRDVTREREKAEALHAVEEALRQSQKMEAVGQLTGGLAHDFNNLLTGVMGSLELMQTRVAQGRFEDVGRYVSAAQGAARRAAALTHRLLAFSRRQTLDPAVTDVNRLVAGMEELVRRTVGPEIALEVVAAGGLWATLVDRGQLENALLNLCINARDAMPHGGKLVIETGNRWLDESAARERDVVAGQYVSMCVSDNGSGMAADVVARAFDPFFTTKPIGQGTGLGLSMVYGFARQSGGQVRIYSEVGAGSTVCLYLPRAGGEAEEVESPGESLALARAVEGETVLVVDDEPTIRMLVAEVLEGLGYTAIEAGDGAAGLAVLRSAVRVDLLVTDVGLPGGMNGRQLADAGRGVRPELKVLFITGYAENAVLSHGHLAPGMHVLTKPFGMEALAARIKGLIVGG